MSVACVFLPFGTPKFGEHSPNPETPGRCFCFALYGKEEMWGCRWFEIWKDLVELAVKRGQRLKVYYFPGEVGYGEVLWRKLAAHSLLRARVMASVPKSDEGWPKKLTETENKDFLATLTEEQKHCMVGLGGSQKGEVAYLKTRRHETGNAGYDFDRVDVRELIIEKGIRPLCGPLVEKLGQEWARVRLSLMEQELGTLETAISAMLGGNDGLMEAALLGDKTDAKSAEVHGKRSTTRGKVAPVPVTTRIIAVQPVEENDQTEGIEVEEVVNDQTEGIEAAAARTPPCATSSPTGPLRSSPGAPLS